MKKKLLFGITVCTFVAVVIAITLNVNFSTNSTDLSDIALANVEALASNEGGNCGCYGPKNISNAQDPYIIWCQCINDVCCMDNYGCN